LAQKATSAKEKKALERLYFASNNCLNFNVAYEILVPKRQQERRSPSMLERTSRFVLEVLPYLIVATCAAILIPMFLSS